MHHWTGLRRLRHPIPHPNQQHANRNQPAHRLHHNLPSRGKLPVQSPSNRNRNMVSLYFTGCSFLKFRSCSALCRVLALTCNCSISRSVTSTFIALLSILAPSGTIAVTCACVSTAANIGFIVSRMLSIDVLSMICLCASFCWSWPHLLNSST